jgi:hypothetical protein
MQLKHRFARSCSNGQVIAVGACPPEAGKLAGDFTSEIASKLAPTTASIRLSPQITTTTTSISA